METIHFDVMLAKLAQPTNTPHRLAYVVAQGKHKGEVRNYVVWSGAPKSQRTNGTASEAGAKPPRATLRDTGNLFFTEFGSGRLLTLFSYNIVTFNGKSVVS